MGMLRVAFNRGGKLLQYVHIYYNSNKTRELVTCILYMYFREYSCVFTKLLTGTRVSKDFQFCVFGSPLPPKKQRTASWYSVNDSLLSQRKMILTICLLKFKIYNIQRFTISKDFQFRVSGSWNNRKCTCRLNFQYSLSLWVNGVATSIDSENSERGGGSRLAPQEPTCTK